MISNLVVAAMALAAPAPEDSVQFIEGSYEKALQEASSKNLPLFIDFYTDWCGWCKVLDREVYANPAVGKFLNSRAVSVKVNAEKEEGPELRKKYQLRGYPTAVMVDSKTQEEIDRIVGFSPPELYLLMLKDIFSGKSYAEIRKRALANPEDVDTWFEYAGKLEQRDTEKAREAWKKVISLDPEDKKGKGAMALCTLARMEAFEKRDPAPLLEIAGKFDGKAAARDAHEYLVRLLLRSEEEKNQKQVIDSYQYLVDHGERDSQTLNNYAWYLATRDRSLKKALEMAREAAEMDPGAAYILDTVAECHFRLGRKKEALAMAKKAVEAARPEEKARYEKRLKEFESREMPRRREF